MKRLAIVLLLVACAHSPIKVVANTSPSFYPPIPDTIWVAAGPIPVLLSDSLPAGPNQFPLGQFQTLNRRVLVNVAIKSTAQRWKTLEHERCHITLRDSGLEFLMGQNGIDGALFELLCDAFASARIAQMAHP